MEGPRGSAPISAEHPCTPPAHSLILVLWIGAPRPWGQRNTPGQGVTRGCWTQSSEVVTMPAKSGRAPQRRCAGLGLRDNGRELGVQGGEWQQVRLRMEMEPGPRMPLRRRLVCSRVQHYGQRGTGFGVDGRVMGTELVSVPVMCRRGSVYSRAGCALPNSQGSQSCCDLC